MGGGHVSRGQVGGYRHEHVHVGSTGEAQWGDPGEVRNWVERECASERGTAIHTIATRIGTATQSQTIIVTLRSVINELSNTNTLSFVTYIT